MEYCTYLAMYDQENIRWKISLFVRLYTMFIWIHLFSVKGQWIKFFVPLLNNPNKAAELKSLVCICQMRKGEPNNFFLYSNIFYFKKMFAKRFLVFHAGYIDQEYNFTYIKNFNQYLTSGSLWWLFPFNNKMWLHAIYKYAHNAIWKWFILLGTIKLTSNSRCFLHLFCINVLISMRIDICTFRYLHLWYSLSLKDCLSLS